MAQEGVTAPTDSLALHKAVEYEVIRRVKLLLPITKNVNKTDENGNTALILACQKNENDAIIELFLNHAGVNFNVADEGGYTALHYLSLRGRLAAIKKIFSKVNLDVNVETETKDTPLILAAKMGRVDVIRFLAEKGANIDHCNNKEFSALLYACYNDRYEAAKLLIELGANVNLKNARDQTPLIKATEWGNLEICNLLLQNGAHVDAECNYDKTALIYACNWGQTEIARLLLENGADVNHVGFETYPGNKWTALSKACYKHKPRLVKLLLEYGADVHYPGPYCLALDRCRVGRNACADLLIGAGASFRSWRN